MTPSEIAAFLAGIAVIILLARLFGHLAHRLGQPSVVGEIIAGILLGPTLLGSLWPAFSEHLFPSADHVRATFNALATLSVCLFMVVAGMDVDLVMIRRQGKNAGIIATLGTALPLFISLGLGYGFPSFWGCGQTSRYVFALYFATAISISALPIIIRILTDLRLFKSNFGMMVVAVAILKDLFGWFLFSVVMALAGGASVPHRSPALTILLTLTLVALSLTLGRKLVQRTLPWVQKQFPWPGVILTLIISGSLLLAALTEWIGVHAVFGAFLGGILFGESLRFEAKTREITEQFITNIFAPIFFASIGFQANFITALQPALMAAVLGLAIIGKWISFSLGARLAGLKPPETQATSAALLSSGIMGIILGLVGLEKGFITRELFVALVIMALVTSILSGPLLSALLRLGQRKGLLEILDPDFFVTDLQAANPAEAIRTLARLLARKTGLPSEPLAEMVIAGEQAMSTGLGKGLALPHGQCAGIKRPYLAVGRSTQGIDFNAPDGKPSHWIFLLLTPQEQDLVQVQILSAIARRFNDEKFRHELRAIDTFHQFRRLIETTSDADSPGGL